MTYAIAVSNITHDLLACEPDSPDDQRVRAAAEEHLGEAMRHDEPYSVARGLTLLAPQDDDGMIPGSGIAHFALAFWSNPQQGYLTDERGHVYGAAIESNT